jgi:hypothetical protein
VCTKKAKISPVPRYAATPLQIVVLKQSAAAVATSREGHRSRRSGPEVRHQRWGRGSSSGGVRQGAHLTPVSMK